MEQRATTILGYMGGKPLLYVAATKPGWKVHFCYAKGLRHANCLKTIGLLFYHYSWCRSTPKIFGVTYMFSSVATKVTQKDS